MKLHYYPETDSLYIKLRNGAGVEVREIVEGFNADIDAAGLIVGFDIDHASAVLDLTTLDAVALPHNATKPTLS